MLPTRLVADGVTVLARPKVSVLGLAHDFPFYLALAWEQGDADCPVWEYGDLRIRREGESLCLNFGGPDVGCAPFPELLDAANEFAQAVRDYILKWLPELADDPDWGEWLRGPSEVATPDDDASSA